RVCDSEAVGPPAGKVRSGACHAGEHEVPIPEQFGVLGSRFDDLFGRALRAGSLLDAGPPPDTRGLVVCAGGRRRPRTADAALADAVPTAARLPVAVHARPLRCPSRVSAATHQVRPSDVRHQSPADGRGDPRTQGRAADLGSLAGALWPAVAACWLIA